MQDALYRSKLLKFFMCFLVKGLGGVFVSKHTPESSKDMAELLKP